MHLKKSVKIIFFVLLLLLICFLVLKKRNFKLDYQVDGYFVYEEYNYKTNNHEITIELANDEYTVYLNHSYYRRQKNVLGIDKIKDNEDVCLVFKTKKIPIDTICYDQDNNFYSPYLASENMKKSLNIKDKASKEIDKYQGISIYDYHDHNYLIWNYHGFYHINSSNNESIRLFNKDTYNADLLYQLNDYIVVADYSDSYYFKKLYIYNTKNNKIDELELNEEISFNSQFLGNYKKSIFLFDNKEKKEYEIVPHREKFRRLKEPVILDNYELKTTSANNIINKKSTWQNISTTSYVIKNNVLYKYYVMDKLIKISDLFVTKILYSDNDQVYYLVNDTLYCYDNSGETKILSYNEWTFNNSNPLFVY